MWNTFSNNELLLFLGIEDSDNFLTHLSQYSYPRRLRELIGKEAASSKVRTHATFNKGIFLASVPIQILSMGVSLGVLTTVGLITTLAAASLMISTLLAWYAIEVSSQKNLKQEELLLKRKICVEVKRDILNVLNQRITRKVDKELTDWHRLKSNAPLPLTSFSADFKKNLLKEMIKSQPAETRPVIFTAPTGSDKLKRDPDSLIYPFATCAMLSTLLGTIFWGSSKILLAVGMSTVATAMVSPLGVGVAVLLAGVLSGYIIYQHYLYQKHVFGIEDSINSMEQENAKIFQEYSMNYSLNRTLKQAKNSQDESRAHQTLDLNGKFRQRNPSELSSVIPIEMSESRTGSEPLIYWPTGSMQGRC